jgi:hypothetical protein
MALLARLKALYRGTEKKAVIVSHSRERLQLTGKWTEPRAPAYPALGGREIERIIICKQKGTLKGGKRDAKPKR